MKRMLIICGPTATGKTKLALRLAKVFNGELISADSRQVYQGMDVGTGKDLPQDAQWHLAEFPISNFQFPIGFWETKNRTKIWGYDLVKPTEEFSVGQYVKVVQKIIKDIDKKGKLPILVGGTGLYIKGVVDGIETAFIAKDRVLRESLEKKKATELFEILTKQDPAKAASLNISDRNNPRRLVRAIEIVTTKPPKETKVQKSLVKGALLIGLMAPKEILNRKIEKRVQKRIKQGIESEIRRLLKQGVSWNNQSMQALGYKQWAQYKSYLLAGSAGQAIRRKVIERWIKAEQQYAKRQITWFKKDSRINWYDVTKKGWQKDVEKKVRSWYSLS